jgi:hypothetical protein
MLLSTVRIGSHPHVTFRMAAVALLLHPMPGDGSICDCFLIALRHRRLHGHIGRLIVRNDAATAATRAVQRAQRPRGPVRRTRIAKHPSATVGPQLWARRTVRTRVVSQRSNAVLSIGRPPTGDALRTHFDAHRRAAVLERPVHGEALLCNGHLRRSPPLLAFTRLHAPSVCRHGPSLSARVCCFDVLLCMLRFAGSSGELTVH